jgi:hypothetical protein
MERDEDGVVLGSTRLSGSQRLHQKGDATREAGSLVGPMTAADSTSAISVFRLSIESTTNSKRRILFCRTVNFAVFVAPSFEVTVAANFLARGLAMHRTKLTATENPCPN